MQLLKWRGLSPQPWSQPSGKCILFNALFFTLMRTDPPEQGHVGKVCISKLKVTGGTVSKQRGNVAFFHFSDFQAMIVFHVGCCFSPSLNDMGWTIRQWYHPTRDEESCKPLIEGVYRNSFHGVFQSWTESAHFGRPKQISSLFPR